MSCLYPIVIKTPSGKSYNVPCRHCLNCRISYQTQLEFMCKNELYYCYRSGHGASSLFPVICLTQFYKQNGCLRVTIKNHYLWVFAISCSCCFFVESYKTLNEHEESCFVFWFYYRNLRGNSLQDC